MSPHYSETGPSSVREGNRRHSYSCLLFESSHNEANQKRLARGATGMIVFSVVNTVIAVLCKYRDSVQEIDAVLRRPPKLLSTVLPVRAA